MTSATRFHQFLPKAFFARWRRERGAGVILIIFDYDIKNLYLIKCTKSLGFTSESISLPILYEILIPLIEFCPHLLWSLVYHDGRKYRLE